MALRYKNVPPNVELETRRAMPVAEMAKRRLEIQRACVGDRALQKVVMQKCREDISFWINHFVWLFEPRKKQELPWVTRPYQDDCLREMVRCIRDGENLHIFKTRDMGVSWKGMAVMGHQAIFEPLSTFIAASHSADAVDANDNPNTLFWKLMFMLERLPSWMVDKRAIMAKRTQMHIYFPETGSVINGETTSKRTGVGGRCRMVWLDEFDKMEGCEAIFDSNQAVSDCVIACSALYGKGLHWKHGFTPEFAHLNRMYLHWVQCPEKAKDAYATGEDGKLVQIGPNPLPAGYKPILDGKIRSSYYDVQCGRFSSPAALAAEIDMNPEEAGGQYFPSVLIDRLKIEHVRPPLLTGELGWDANTGEPSGFSHSKTGRLLLWHNLDYKNMPPPADYVLGIDVSGGTGASNSVVSVADRRIGEKVAEFAVADMLPERFAKFCVALARWYHDGFMIWEANNHGHPFGHVVAKDLGYRNIYYRDAKVNTVTPTATQTYGYHTAAGNKETLFANYRDALHSGAFTNRSLQAVEELADYSTDEKGKPISFKAKANFDRKTGARTAHADRVQADAMVAMIVAQAAREMMRSKGQGQEEAAPFGSYNWFEKHVWNKQREEEMAL